MSSSLVLWASVALPFKGPASSWRLYEYDDVPPSQVSFQRDGLHVKIDKSVRPIVYVLPEAKSFQGFRVEADFKGLPIREGSTRNDYDDKALRLGLIVPGETRPNFVERMVMPKFTMKLIEELGSKGLEKIYYYSLATASTSNLSRVTYSRFHQERVLAVLEKPGPFSGDFKFERPHNVAAIWISIDGDDTKSAYEVLLKKLELY